MVKEAAAAIMPPTLKRVAIVGPECSGKTTLAEALTIILTMVNVKVRCVPEYAREYYRNRCYQPSPHDVLAIARGQVMAEQQAAWNADILICDSTVTTCKIWSEVMFGYVDPALLKLYCPTAYDLTVLTRPDICWEADPLRSAPHSRDQLFGLYQAELMRHKVRWIGVAGSHKKRVAHVLQALCARGFVVPKI